MLDAERKTHIFLDVGLRETDTKLRSDDQLPYGEGQRRTSRRLCRAQGQGVGTAEAITVSNFEVLSRLEFQDDIKHSVLANPEIGFFSRPNKVAFALEKCDQEENENTVSEI